jgi:hypothetical protein
MAQTIENLFFYLANFSDVLIIIIFFIFLKKFKREKSLWFILLVSIFSLLINYSIELELFSAHLGLFYCLFTFFEYCFFTCFLYLNISNRKFKNLMLISSGLFITFLIFYYYSQVIFTNVDSVPIGIETILILIFSFYYLYEQMNDAANQFVYNKYPFWIISGFMVYLAGGFFIYVFANQVDRTTLDEFWFLTPVLYFIKNILFTVGIFIFIKQPKNPSTQKLRPYLN